MSSSNASTLDESTWLRLCECAGKRGCTPQAVMRTACEQYLDQEEQYEREQVEDEQRWHEYLLTGVAIDHALVDQWMEQAS